MSKREGEGERERGARRRLGPGPAGARMGAAAVSALCLNEPEELKMSEDLGEARVGGLQSGGRPPVPGSPPQSVRKKAWAEVVWQWWRQEAPRWRGGAGTGQVGV